MIMENNKSNVVEALLNEIDPLEQKKTDAKMLLAAKIADAMKAKGWKNKDLLAAVNKENPSIITKWLSGTHNFTVDTLVEVGQALGIDLLNLEENNTRIILQCHQSVSQPTLPGPFNPGVFDVYYRPEEHKRGFPIDICNRTSSSHHHTAKA